MGKQAEVARNSYVGKFSVVHGGNTSRRKSMVASMGCTPSSTGAPLTSSTCCPPTPVTTAAQGQILAVCANDSSDDDDDNDDDDPKKKKDRDSSDLRAPKM